VIFENISKLSYLLSKDYARGILSLLASYNSISSSVAASHLDIHIKTAQDFLEGMFEIGILSREEVRDGKRPYYQYFLAQRKHTIELDFDALVEPFDINKVLDAKIREKSDNAAAFHTSSKSGEISAVTLYEGKGRFRKERKILLTADQGRFLFHIPFPTENLLSIREIIQKAGIGIKSASELADIFSILDRAGALEIEPI
jgi:hypothetical protein